jgi:hypothetical protein
MSTAKAAAPVWTTVADVVQTLRRRWETGGFLSAHAVGRRWEPVPVPIRGPSAAELGEHFSAAQVWAAGWIGGAASLRVDTKSVGGRRVGVNTVPNRAWVDSYEQLWSVLRVAHEVRRFDALFEETSRSEPMLVGWMAEHPMKVLAVADSWMRIVATVTWIAQLQQPHVYLRQVDVPGVDTKFIEGHRAVLTDLLDRRLPIGRIDGSVPRSDFTGRYGFRKKPSYVRMRQLGAIGLPGGYSEIALRVAELADNPLPVSTVYVVENEVTYLAFPAVPDAVVILGEGYAASRLQPLRWLEERTVVYWGDIDTHGFRILDRLRARFPRARSMLMDRATLFAHETQWVAEPSPIRDPLARLTADERALYLDLVEDSFGVALRLEQERVGFSAIEKALGLTPP